METRDNHFMPFMVMEILNCIFRDSDRRKGRRFLIYWAWYPAIAYLMASILTFSCLSPSVMASPSDDWANLALTSGGYPPGVKGATDFLKSLDADSATRELTAGLIDRLGSENYDERQGAMTQLATLRIVDLAALRAEQASENAEVRWRIRKLLEKRQLAAASLLSASLSILERVDSRVERELVWNGTLLADDRSCVGSLSRFISVAYKADFEAVRRRAQSGDPLTRVVAIESLRLMVEPQKAAELVRPLLQDPHPMVSLSVCRILADVGERDALRTLASLSASDDQEVASTANWLLESLTGEFPDGQLSNNRDPKEIARFWQDWCDTTGRSAILRFPVARNFSARGNLQGGMLFSTGSLGKISLTNRAGDKIWEYDLPAWSAEKLRNGNILIASYDREEVREVTLDNRLVWRWSEPNYRPIRAKPLPNGNVLVADFESGRAVELTSSGQRTWEVDVGEENCFDVERLENGNTLIATPSSLVEFRHNKEKVKTIPVTGRINSVQVLPSGNFLIANHGLNAVMELNRNGEVLWKYPELGASEAFQTDDGHYLITSDRRCIELSPDRTRVRVLHSATYGSARR
jgi:hypothetical protein